MQRKEVEYLLNQPIVSRSVKEKVLKKVTALTKDEKDYEVVVSPTNVTIDVYEGGVRVEREKLKLCRV